MNRSFFNCVSGLTAVAIVAHSAVTQTGALVRLQSTTPGAAQTGHMNITGTARAAQFVGGGSGLTSVNALTLNSIDASLFGRRDLANSWTQANTFSNAANSFTGNGAGLLNVDATSLDGIDGSRYLTDAEPLDVVLSAAGQNVIAGTNPNSASGSSGIAGYTLSTSGAPTNGGYFFAQGPGGRAVFAETYGESAVYGRSYGPSGGTAAGRFVCTTAGGLGVVGSVSAATGTGVAGAFYMSSSAGTGLFAFLANGAGSGYAVHAQSDAPGGWAGFFEGRSHFSGRVGIGDTNPGHMLEIVTADQTPAQINSSHVGGTWVNLNNTSTGAGNWNLISTGSGNGEGAGQFLLRNATNSFVALTALKTGFVGVGLTNPAFRLDLPNTSDNFGKGRANAWVTYSSGRWKEDVQPLDDALNTVKQLKGVSYRWKEPYGGAKDLGFIAEEVGRVLPEIVSWDKTKTYADGLDYGRIVPLLVESVKTLSTKVDTMEARMLKMEAELARLKGDGR